MNASDRGHFNISWLIIGIRSELGERRGKVSISASLILMGELTTYLLLHCQYISEVMRDDDHIDLTAYHSLFVNIIVGLRIS